MEISSSASADKYYWMRYSADTKARIKTNDTTVTIEKNQLFGVRELRGKPFDEFLLVDGTVFRLDISKSEKIMDRSKEYRGKVPTVVAKKATPVVAPKAPVHRDAPKNVNERKFVNLLTKNKAGNMLTLAEFKRIIASLTQQDQVAFKNWFKFYATKNSVCTIKAYQAMVNFPVATDTQKIRIVKPKAVAPKKTTITPVTGANGTVQLRVEEREVQPHEIDFPEVDDFYDHDVPSEFKQYTRVESKESIPGGNSPCTVKPGI